MNPKLVSGRGASALEPAWGVLWALAFGEQS